MNAKLKPTLINDMNINPKKLEAKKRLLERIYHGIKEGYSEKYEKIYDSVLAKDTMLEWMSVQQEYQQQPIEQDAPDHRRREGWSSTEEASQRVREAWREKLEFTSWWRCKFMDSAT